jgi:hypothetical protein
MVVFGVPLLIIPFAFYNVVAFFLPGLEWAQPLARTRMPSGTSWTLTLGDFVVAIAVFILFLEVSKSIRVERRGLLDHLLSFLLFVVMLVEFLVVKQAATSTFFLLLVTCLVDGIGGLAFSLKELRRKVAFEGVDQAPPP